MKMNFVARSALVAMAVAVPAKGALADGTLTPYRAVAPFERTLRAPGVEVGTRGLGGWVVADPYCRRIVGSGPMNPVSLEAKVKFRCEGLSGEYTVICKLSHLDCPPRRFTYVVAYEPKYPRIVYRLPEGPDPAPPAALTVPRSMKLWNNRRPSRTNLFRSRP